MVTYSLAFDHPTMAREGNSILADIGFWGIEGRVIMVCLTSHIQSLRVLFELPMRAYRSDCQCFTRPQSLS